MNKVINPRPKGPNVGKIGFRQCGSLTTGCGYWKPLDSFYNHPTCTDGISRRCKLCIGDAYRLRKYKMSRAEWEALQAAQGNRCARCRDPFDRVGSKGKVPATQRGICIDHDHDCPNGCSGDGKGNVSVTCGQCIRGLLCRLCSNLLSTKWCRQNPTDLYLGRYSARQNALERRAA